MIEWNIETTAKFDSKEKLDQFIANKSFHGSAKSVLDSKLKSGFEVAKGMELEKIEISDCGLKATAFFSVWLSRK